MTQDDVIEMARQAGAELYGHPDYATICVNGKDARDFVKAFAKLVAEAEREACAKDAEWCIQNNIEQHIPTRIRARGET